MTLLHITDGSVAADLLAAASIEGERLSWDDVLHEGPVPAGLDLAALSKVRTDFIADAGWDDRASVEAKFATRDGRLRVLARDVDEIVLWFEDDLYDQLQLVQVLDLLAGDVATVVPVSLVQLDGPFGMLRPADMPGLLAARREVTERQTVQAKRAWAAFRAPRPDDLQGLLGEDIDELPYLREAIVRHLEEFPSIGTGLTGTELRMLAAVAGNRLTAAKLFKTCLDAEKRAFLGDTVFLWLLKPLTEGPEPLMAFQGAMPAGLARDPNLVWGAPLELTAAGKQVLSGRGDWMTMSGREMWRGGVLVNAGNDWRHDPTSGTVRLKAQYHG